MPGRPLGAVLEEGDGKHGRRDDDGIGAVERGGGEMGRRRRDRAEAKCRTGAAGRVGQLAGVIGRRIAVGIRGLLRLTGTVAGVGAGLHLMTDDGMVADILDAGIVAGLPVNRRACQAEAAGNRLQRKQGHEQANEQFLEDAVHSGPEYSTTAGTWRTASGGAGCYFAGASIR